MFSDLADARKPTAREGLLLDAPPVWSQQKSEFIASYLAKFQQVTKSGVFIDGFAGPQRQGNADELWTAKKVLELKPKWMTGFYLCDLNAKSVEMLRELKSEHHQNPKGRRVAVFEGDFNQSIDTILLARRIKTRTPTFALLDMRTFECDWDTVRKLATYRKGPYKIELLYFLATGWIARAASKKDHAALERWWGGEDWSEFIGKQKEILAEHVCNRMQKEFGYKYVVPYPIFQDGGSKRVYYFLIHATDHDRAPDLMKSAYRQIVGDRKGTPTDSQQNLFE